MSLKWWIPGMDLTEYKVEFQRDEAWRLNIIAGKLSKGGLNTPDKIRRLAHRLGCSSRHIIRVMAQPEMMAAVKHLVKMRAAYGTAEALGSQVENAKKDVMAFKTIGQMGGVIEVGGGTKVQVNTTIDRRNGGDNEAAVGFIEIMRQRGLKRINTPQTLQIAPEASSEPEPDFE